MSNEFFPSAQLGFVWDCTKKPMFNNYVHSSNTGRDVRIALYSEPVFEFMLINQWLTKSEKDQLLGFFQARQGGFDTFLFSDEDSTADQELLATGDGTTHYFQIKKATDGYTATANNVGNVQVYDNDTLLTLNTHYTLSASGLIDYALPSGHLLSWSGIAYYRCVFTDNELEYSQFADRLYECGEIKFKGCMANKL